MYALYGSMGAVAAALLLAAACAAAADMPPTQQSAAEAALGFLRLWTGAALPGAAGTVPPPQPQLPTHLNVSAADRPPVVFIPPLGGVQLRMKLRDAAAPRFWCPRSTAGAWRLAWLNPLALLPGLFPCWADNFGLGAVNWRLLLPARLPCTQAHRQAPACSPPGAG